MIRACVMGFPISHSLSPRLHGFWLKKYNIDGEYSRVEAEPGNLRAALDKMVQDGFAGCNLTTPLKELALPLMDKLDESAMIAGAVNTVAIHNGQTVGYNSDGFGFIAGLTAQYPNWDDSKIVIIGAGGAARGIIAALLRAGTKNIMIVNRTPQKAEKLARDFGLDHTSMVEWKARHLALKDASLVIQCTNLGMTGMDPLDLDLTHLPPTAVVCDIIYKPHVTQLLADAHQRGNAIQNGLPMLLHQGRLGFHRWFGIDPEVTPELFNEMKRDMT